MYSPQYGGSPQYGYGENPPLDALEYNLLGSIGNDAGTFHYGQQEAWPDMGGGDPRGALDKLPTRPVPFHLRSIQSPQLAYRLRSATFIGRSGGKLRDCDIKLESPDVSRVHAHIKVRGDELRGWELRIVDESSVSGTDVDGEPVPLGPQGKKVEVGSYVRFGAKELWVVERRSLQARSSKLVHNEETDGQMAGEGVGWQEVRVKTQEHHQSIRRVKDWYDLVELLVEMLNAKGRIPPCADIIMLYDDRGGYCSEHRVTSPKEMEEYEVRENMLKDIHLGHIVRFHLSSEPLLLAPLVERLERKRRAEEERRTNMMPSFG